MGGGGGGGGKDGGGGGGLSVPFPPFYFHYPRLITLLFSTN
jgi:hypothetical protein